MTLSTQIGPSEGQLREALRQSPQNQALAVALSDKLVATDRALEAEALMAPFVARPAAVRA